MMEDFQQILPITKVKRNLLDIVKSMEQEETTIALTRNGEPVSVLMPVSRYEALLETIDILSDKQTMRSLEKSEKDFKSGRVFSHEEVWKD
ncbi:MAG TPA: type II toxin-antitoxin system Phd/YefM family antitoxin [Desulfatiglandales bacterium]|nr:type II toxin-antitoxin system Phd/YefM family antitoxin [Desulfatiglandales bacterium]